MFSQVDFSAVAGLDHLRPVLPVQVAMRQDEDGEGRVRLFLAVEGGAAPGLELGGDLIQVILQVPSVELLGDGLEACF